MPPKNKGRVEPAPFKGFIEYDLTVEEKATIKSRVFDIVEADTALENLVKAEYRVSFGFDFYNQSFTCSLSHKDPKHGNAGFVLVGRGSTPHKALKQVLFKHYEVFDEVWHDARSMSRLEIDD